MHDTQSFALVVLLIGAVGVVGVLSNRLTERLRVPAAAVLLVAAAVVVEVVPALHAPPAWVVEQVVSIALVLILFDGGMDIGWRRFREAAVPISVVGVVGTFLTAGGCALLVHAAFGLDWYAAALVATAVAPTDPAVVFSVLGGREIAGRSGTILEGRVGRERPGRHRVDGEPGRGGQASAGARRRRGRRVRAADGVGAVVGVRRWPGAALVHADGAASRPRGCTRCGRSPACWCCSGGHAAARLGLPRRVHRRGPASATSERRTSGRSAVPRGARAAWASSWRSSCWA